MKKNVRNFLHIIALIDKLNYLIFKNEANLETPGSVLKGYQLTEKLDSFARLGSQCGFIFYVPADYTSKIDPTTGFINIFDTKECKTAESIKKFFDDFDSITYSASKDSFAFKFDYRKVKTYQNKKDYQNIWTVFSTKEAWAQEKDKKTGIFSPVFHNPTLEIKTAIEDLGLTVKDNFDLLSLIRSLEAQNSTAKFFKSLIYAFKLSVALRHSHDNEDKIISPVENLQGECFISQICENNLMPQDADANGAFHIALKGLYLLQNCIKDGKLGKISFENWIKFAQCRNK